MPYWKVINNFILKRSSLFFFGQEKLDFFCYTFSERFISSDFVFVENERSYRHLYESPQLFFHPRQSIMKNQYQQRKILKPACQHTPTMIHIIRKERYFSQQLTSLILTIPVLSQSIAKQKRLASQNQCIKQQNQIMAVMISNNFFINIIIFSQINNPIFLFIIIPSPEILLYFSWVSLKKRPSVCKVQSFSQLIITPMHILNRTSILQQMIGCDLKCYNNNQMEYKLSPFSHLETQALTPGMRQNVPFTHMFPPNDFQLHHLYSLISNLYQEQQTTKEELKTVKEELTTLKDRLKVQEQEKQQEESQRQGKEEETSKLSNPKKKICKEVQCQMPSCGKKYGSVTALRAHMRLKHVTNDDNLDFVPL